MTILISLFLALCPLCPNDCPSRSDYWPYADYNLDGGVDGYDVEAFFCDWVDGIRIDIDGDGGDETDLDGDQECTWCDAYYWLWGWYWGGDRPW